MLGGILRGDVDDPHAVIDLRDTVATEHDAVAGLVVLDRVLHDERDGGLWVRVTTTGRVEACAAGDGRRHALLG